MIEPVVLWKGNLGPDEICVDVLEESRRKIDSNVESRLQRQWNAKLEEAEQKGQVLYDGESFRLEGFSEEEGRLLLEMSLMRFSVRSILKKMPELETLGDEYFSHGLSVGGFVVTSDGQFVFAQKGSQSASGLKTDLIGGVLEHVQPLDGRGILRMNEQEMQEEMNVSSEHIANMRVIGMVRSATTDIVIVTKTELKLSASEVRTLFEQREDRELEALVFVDPSNIAGYLQELGGYKVAMMGLLN